MVWSIVIVFMGDSQSRINDFSLQAWCSSVFQARARWSHRMADRKNCEQEMLEGSERFRNPKSPISLALCSYSYFLNLE
jgi:hypothetical protein